jgi:shikimate kinase
MPNDPTHLVLMGMMGVGKTTLGTALARSLNWDHVDSDVQFESLAGMSGAAYTARFGVDALHELEVAVIVADLTSNTNTVISAAAFTIESPAVRSLLAQRAVVVYLSLGVDETLLRQATGSHRRPMSKVELEMLERRRRPLFLEAAELVLDANEPLDNLVAKVLNIKALLT